MMSVKSDLHAYLLKEFLEGEDPDLLTEDTELIESGVLNSLALIKLVSFLASQYGVKVQADEMDQLGTIAEIERMVNTQKPASSRRQRRSFYPGFSEADSPKTSDISGLPPFLRTLVVADGTLTKLLEAFIWEPIEVRLLTQRMGKASSTETGFDSDDDVIRRDVVLSSGNRVYVYASSLISVTNLLPELSQALISGKKGIGALLRERRLETFRELHSLTIHDAGEMARHLDVPRETPVVERFYRIRHAGKTIMQIMEAFPIELYESPLA